MLAVIVFRPLGRLPVLREGGRLRGSQPHFRGSDTLSWLGDCKRCGFSGGCRWMGSSGLAPPPNPKTLTGRACRQ